MQPAGDDVTLRTRIYKQLRRAIIMGRRAPGERLSVEELCRTYESGISPVRDALQMLGQEGLVTIKPRSGYFVTSVTLKELRDMLEVREVLEVAVVERAALRITAAQLDALSAVHTGYTGDDDESYDRYTDENRQFHYLLGQASGNAELAEMLGRLHDRLARFMVLRHAGATQHETHAAIIAALRAHDVAAARKAMLDEITTSRQTILDRVMQGEGASWQITALK